VTTSLLTLSVLHLDDDPFELDRVKTALEHHALACNFVVTSVSTPQEFLNALADDPDVIILDVHINDEHTSGIELASTTREKLPSAVILMCSSADDVGTIKDSLSAQSDDFISKRSDKGELSLRVLNSYQLASLKRPTKKNFVSPTPKAPDEPVGATISSITGRIPRLLDSAVSAVFISGESGTGKEVVADLIGQALQSGTPFVKVNCGAISPSLLESELFGHVKGAFTGAVSDKRGLLESASGGWIFLDEVATLSPAAQTALLRVLENKTLLRVGSTKPVQVDLRVLSATNEPLASLVDKGKFRADLWQRLRETEISLPPLRERPDEIPALVNHFCATMAGGPYTISGPALTALCSMSWRAGNIRELRNCLRAMTEHHVNKLLTPLAIPERIWDEIGDQKTSEDTGTKSVDLRPGKPSAGKDQIVLPWSLDSRYTYDYLCDLLLLDITRKVADRPGRLSLRGLAQTIGMSRSTLSTRLKALVHRNLISLRELSQLVGINEA